MSYQLTVIDSPHHINSLKEYLADKELVSFDEETTGLTMRDLVIGFSLCASETEAYYVILAFWDPENKTLVRLEENITAAIEVLKSLQGKKLIMHNGTFDCMMAEANYKISLIESLHTDTMILAHLLNENRPVGLKPLAKEYFGENSTDEQDEMNASIIANGGVVSKSVYELYKADPYLIGKYGAKDAWLTYMLFMKLIPELYEQELDTFFYEESMPLLRGPTYHLNTTGLKVDTAKLSSLKKQLEAECLEAKHSIMTQIENFIKEKYPGTTKKNTFSIGSSQQLAWLLFGQLNLEFTSLTDGGKDVLKFFGLKGPYTRGAQKDFIVTCERQKGQFMTQPSIVNGKKKQGKKVKEPWAYIKCDKKALQKVANKYEWIKTLLEYQRKMKILNTYVEGIEERVQYGIVHPSFLQHGTTSGRYASRDPNFQNLPRDDKRIKECIVARPGKVFVGADQSQLEPRIFAYYSKDPRLMAAFDGTSDFYSVVGIPVFQKYDATPQKEGSSNAFGVKYKPLRDKSKVFALARAYGATANQLAPMLGLSTEDTQDLLDDYDRNFPGVPTMAKEAHDLVKQHGYVTNLFGRPRRIPEAKNIKKLYGNQKHSDYPYNVRNMLNLAVNHRIQSTGASIMNRAAIRFYDNLKTAGLDAKIVAQVHDSLIAECSPDDAEAVALLMQDALENTIVLTGISFEAIPKIGYNLAEV